MAAIPPTTTIDLLPLLSANYRYNTPSAIFTSPQASAFLRCRGYPFPRGSALSCIGVIASRVAAVIPIPAWWLGHIPRGRREDWLGRRQGKGRLIGIRKWVDGSGVPVPR